MQSLHRYVVIKKILKYFFLIVGLWMVSLLTIVTEYKTATMLFRQGTTYEQSLSKLRNPKNNNTGSAFRAWELMHSGKDNKNLNSSMKILKSHDHPPGVNGRPVILERNLKHEIKEKIRAGWWEYAFNEFVSNLIPVNRSLIDPRDEWCKNQNYSSDLPTATVIICFFDEAWSTLIRTITSVLNRSPPHLLDQIILVDDNSTLDHLRNPLDEYVATIPKVTLRRSPHRLGIIGARLLTVPEVKSPVIIYLDSHCECAEGWLEPLLQRIKENYTTIVSPVVDHIDENTFEYIKQETDDLRMGGFTWDLRFAWIGIPPKVYSERSQAAAPIKTPTISGGIFAIDKTFFKNTGYYDTGMELWGAENLELSFKTWMCGGSMEIVPCSHVGHIFRKRIPYEELMKSLKRNFVRLAEVWLDDYAKYYYERIGNKRGKFGNITERMQLRKKLNCKSFQWYIENVYPQIDLPDKYAASGQIYNGKKYDLCLDAAISLQDYDTVNVIPCHFQGGNQYWTYTSIGEIRRDAVCLDYLLNTVTLFLCNNISSQVWLYMEKDQLIKHMVTKQCLSIARYLESYKLVLTDCIGTETQKWIMENFKFDRLALSMQTELKTHKTANLESPKKGHVHNDNHDYKDHEKMNLKHS